MINNMDKDLKDDQMELDNSSDDPVDELEYGMSLLLLKGPDKPLECCD